MMRANTLCLSAEYVADHLTDFFMKSWISICRMGSLEQFCILLRCHFQQGDRCSSLKPLGNLFFGHNKLFYSACRILIIVVMLLSRVRDIIKSIPLCTTIYIIKTLSLAL